MKNVGKSVKDLIAQVLQVENKRISAENIFNHPWMLKEGSKIPLKLSYSKMLNFSKFSKMKKLAATFIATQLSEKEV